MNKEKVECPICNSSAVYTKNDGVIVCDKNFGRDHKFMFGYSEFAEQQLEKTQPIIRCSSTWEVYASSFGPYKLR